MKVIQRNGVLQFEIFNPIGADPSLGIGERISTKTKNIFPILCKAALYDNFTFKVNGNNWDTFDVLVRLYTRN